MRVCYPIILAGLCLWRITQVGAAKDGSLRSFFVDSSNLSVCDPNEGLTGTVCSNLTLHEARLLNNVLRVRLDSNATVDNVSVPSIHVSGKVFLTYFNLSEVPIIDFAFNTSTPNGTLLSEGHTPIGTIEIDAGSVFFPRIPLSVDISHSVSLVVPDENVCSQVHDNTTSTARVPCVQRTVAAVLGLRGGGKITQAASQLTVETNEPRALQVTIDFVETLGATVFCEAISRAAVYDPDMTAKIELCFPGGNNNDLLPCFRDERGLEVGALDQDKGTIAQTCFQHNGYSNN